MKVAVFLNSNELGGAERSVLIQMKDVGLKFDLYVPDLGGDCQKLKDFIGDNGNVHSNMFPIPQSLYSISREAPFLALVWGVVKSLIGLMSNVLRVRKILNQYDVVYLNGNKCGIWVTWINQYFSRGKEKVVFWHLRDYPSGLLCFYLRYLACGSTQKAKFIANSDSVKESFERMTQKRFDVQRIYNLSGLEIKPLKLDFKKHGWVIGVPSMLAPWKGQHQIVMMASLYEAELKAIGVEKIVFFGGDIYKTQGSHCNYKDQLMELLKKFPTELIIFGGELSPHQIFDQIDIAIHSSISAEPFGRIIIESFCSGKPIITTGVGGSSELITHLNNGLRYSTAHYSELFSLIKMLITDEELYRAITSNAQAYVSNQEIEVRKMLRKLFNVEGEKNHSKMES